MCKYLLGIFCAKKYELFLRFVNGLNVTRAEVIRHL